MQYTQGLGTQDINSFTICFRFNVEFLRPVNTNILAYSTYNSDNALGCYLWLQSGSKLHLGLCKYWGLFGITSVCSSTLLKSVRIHDHWHHVCWSVDINEIDSDQIKIDAKLFFDGEEVKKGDLLSLSSFLEYEIHKKNLLCRYT